MATSGLSPPGTSTYSSNTMHVGDGTWDSNRNDFLLPNLQGLNFATMRYNGMGNRFKDEPQYHTLIMGHGIVAAITFMGIFPAAALIARFYTSDRRAAFKLHVYLQILTVFLSTVVLVLGWFAVGPERSLTNPHHGIGVAIYTLILFQFLFGWFMARRERKRSRPHPTIPVKVYIHKLLGRSIGLLAFVQIALGLTLYGSPKSLFILYALGGVILLFWYLTLSYRTLPIPGSAGGRRSGRSDLGYDDSYVSGTQTDVTHDRKKTHWGRDLLAAGGAIGAYEWWKKRRDRKREEQDDYNYQNQRRSHGGPPGTPGPPGPPGPPDGSHVGFARPPSRGSRLDRRHSQSRLSRETWEEDEKYSASPPRHTWRNRILGAGAGIAAFEGVKSMFGSGRRRDDGYADNANYRPPLGGNQNMVSQADVSQVEAGQAPFSPNDPRRNQRVHIADGPPMSPTRLGPRRHPGMSEASYDDQSSYSRPGRNDAGEGHTLRDSIAAMGAIAGFREWSKRRRERKEEQRAHRVRQQELDNEDEFNRRHSGRYPRPEDANGRRQSASGTVMTGPDPAVASNQNVAGQNFNPDTNHPPLPAAAGMLSSGSGFNSNVGPRGSRPNVSDQAGYNLPPPPPGPPPNMQRPAGYRAPDPGSLEMPPGAVNPDPSRLVGARPGASSGHLAEGGALGATAAAAGMGMAAGHRGQSQSPSRYQSRDGSRTRPQRPNQGSASALPFNNNNNGAPEPANSPPVSLKMKVHNDGRHVTLRRLNEEEAAAERASRRTDRRQRRTSSLSSGVEDEGAQRYRRTGGMRTSSNQPITNVPPPPAMSSSAGASHRQPSDLNLPPPPRLPQASNTPPSQAQGYPPPVAGGPFAGSGVGSPSGGALPQGTDLGNATDGSTFDTNRRRRRAERARRAEAAAKGNRVEFE